MAANLPSKQARRLSSLPLALPRRRRRTTEHQNLHHSKQEDSQACLWPFLVDDGAHGAANLVSSKPRRLPKLPLAPPSRRWLQIFHQSKPEDYRAYLWPSLVDDGAQRSSKISITASKKTLKPASGPSSSTTAHTEQRIFATRPFAPSRTATEQRSSPSTPTRGLPIDARRRGLPSTSTTDAAAFHRLKSRNDGRRGLPSTQESLNDGRHGLPSTQGSLTDADGYRRRLEDIARPSTRRRQVSVSTVRLFALIMESFERTY